MLAMIAALSLSSMPMNLPPSWVIVNSKSDIMGCSVSFDESVPGPVAELRDLVALGQISEHIHCGDVSGSSVTFCSVSLDVETQLHGLHTNFPVPGAWSVSFRGPAAVALNSVLEGLETSEGRRGLYISTPSGLVACETEEQVCVVRSHRPPSYEAQNRAGS